MRRAQTLTEFQGRLVPIGELDCIEDLPVREVEVIDLTGEPEVIDLTGGPAIIDLSGKEEEQALEEIRRGVITFDVEVLSQTQTLITHISRLCQEIRNIKR